MQVPNLEQLYGGNSIFGGLLGLEQHNMAMDQAQMQQAKSLQDLFHGFQNQPLDMEAKRLSNEQTAARIPGVQAESSILGRKNRMQGELEPEMTQAERTKLLGEIDLTEFQKFQRMVEQRAMQGDPQAAQMLRQTKGIFEELEKTKARAQADKDLELLKQGGAQKLMQMQIDAGRFKPKSGMANPSNIEEAVVSGKLNFEKAAVAYQVLADSADDETTKAQYLQRAAQYELAAQKKAQAGALARPSADLPALGIPAVGGALPGSTLGTPPAPAGGPKMPTVGEVRGGYMYMGGNPADKNNWKKQ